MTTTKPRTIAWETQHDGYDDILYESAEGISKISINRPEVHNAFRPKTLAELRDAFTRAHMDPETGVIVLTGVGDRAFCSGGDQRIRGDGGYVDEQGTPALSVLQLTGVVGPLNSLTMGVLSYVPNIVGAAVIFFVGFFVPVVLDNGGLRCLRS